MGKQIEKSEKNKLALEQRLKEILKNARSKNVFIIDDYLCNGLTLRQILDAFRSIPTEGRPSVTFLSFFAKQREMYDDSEKEWKKELRSRKETEEWTKEGFKLLLPTQEDNRYAGFAYSHAPDDWYESGAKRKAIMKKSFIGVEKKPGELYARVSSERETELMKQLRNEMRELAEEVLSPLKKKNAWR